MDIQQLIEMIRNKQPFDTFTYIDEQSEGGVIIDFSCYGVIGVDLLVNPVIHGVTMFPHGLYITLEHHEVDDYFNKVIEKAKYLDFEGLFTYCIANELECTKKDLRLWSHGNVDIFCSLMNSSPIMAIYNGSLQHTLMFYSALLEANFRYIRGEVLNHKCVSELKTLEDFKNNIYIRVHVDNLPKRIILPKALYALVSCDEDENYYFKPTPLVPKMKFTSLGGLTDYIVENFS